MLLRLVVFDALITALLIASTEVFFLITKVKSIKETFEVGTLIAVPSSLPLSLGRTKLSAFAAPVDVGIIELPRNKGHVVVAAFVKDSELEIPERERAIAHAARAVHDYFLFN